MFDMKKLQQMQQQMQEEIGNVQKRIIGADPQAIFTKEEEDFCYIVATWMTPEEISAIDEVVEARACTEVL